MPRPKKMPPLPNEVKAIAKVVKVVQKVKPVIVVPKSARHAAKVKETPTGLPKLGRTPKSMFEEMIKLNKEVGRCFNHTDRQFDPKCHENKGGILFFVFTQDGHPGFRVRGFQSNGHTCGYSTRIYPNSRTAHKAAEILSKVPVNIMNDNPFIDDDGLRQHSDRQIRKYFADLPEQERK